MASVTTKGHVDDQGLSDELPETMLMSEDHSATGVMLIWVVPAATGAMVMSGPKLLARAMFWPIVLL